MNIFILDNDLVKSVEYHVDSHVVKMPLEAAQLACTAFWVDQILGFKPRALTKEEQQKLKNAVDFCRKDDNKIILNGVKLYKPTHINHPCAIWTRSRFDNYQYVRHYGLQLGKEKLFRWPENKPHASCTILEYLPDLHDNKVLRSSFALAMPDDYKEQAIDAVDAYRTYYVCAKRHLARWTNRNIPEWWIE